MNKNAPHILLNAFLLKCISLSILHPLPKYYTVKQPLNVTKYGNYMVAMHQFQFTHHKVYIYAPLQLVPFSLLLS